MIEPKKNPVDESEKIRVIEKMKEHKIYLNQEIINYNTE